MLGMKMVTDPSETLMMSRLDSDVHRRIGLDLSLMPGIGCS